MANLLSTAEWDRYKQAINDAGDTFNNQPVTWRRFLRRISRHGEEPNQTFEDIQLKGLISYNFFKSWPDESSLKPAGVTDDSSAVLILNTKHLEDAGYLNTDGYFEFTPGHDTFIIKGIKYKPKGDTDVAQASDSTLGVYIRLDRVQIDTGDNKF